MHRTGTMIINLVATTFAVLTLVACSGAAGTERSPTLISTAASPALPDQSTPAPTATSAPARLTPTPAATPTPPPSPTPCRFPLQDDLDTAWWPEELGCPITPGERAAATAYAPFEGGQMLWRGDTDLVYVLYNDGRWTSYPNEWREGDPAFSCGEENLMTTPVRGFGRVWCDHPEVREALGAVTAGEIGDSVSAVQDFVNGTMLVAPFGGVFILEGEDSTWRRLEE